MFNIFKKKDQTEKPAVSAPEPEAHNHDELVAQADALNERIAATSGEERADLLDERGSLLKQAGETDLAIEAYEQSIEEAKRMGGALRDLTTLYNKKRAEAAALGHGEETKQWLDKIDALMTSSKDMLRGK